MTVVVQESPVYVTPDTDPAANVVVSGHQVQVAITDGSGQPPTVVVSTFTPLSVARIGDLVDVVASSPEDGSLLSYAASEQKWKASRLIREELLDGGNF
jgi:hypothetical protein